jgi:phosphate:Na+ symporter
MITSNTNAVTAQDQAFPIVKAIAIAHTTLNVAVVALMLPTVGLLSKFLIRWIPEKAHKELPHLTALDKRMFDAPAIGIEQSKKEVVKMGQMTEKMMDWLEDVITSEEPDIKTQEKIFNRENVLDVIQKEIVEFISFLLAGNIPHDTAEDAREQLRMADEYESISDYIVNILKMNLKLHDIDEKISEEGKKEILQLHRAVASYLRFINKAVVERNPEIMNKAHTKSKIVTHLMKEFRGNHLDRVAAGHTSPLKSLIFTDMLNAYRRIKDHALNIAEALAGEK